MSDINMNFLEYSPSIDLLIYLLNQAKQEGKTHVDIKIDTFVGAGEIENAIEAGLVSDIQYIKLVVK